MQMRVCQEVGRQASVYWDRMCTIISDYVLITTINSGGTKPASSRLQCSNLNKDMINYRPESEYCSDELIHDFICMYCRFLGHGFT